jgi:enoyl-[acyl-carrier-protein] reductase (NADH)
MLQNKSRINLGIANERLIAWTIGQLIRDQDSAA